MRKSVLIGRMGVSLWTTVPNMTVLALIYKEPVVVVNVILEIELLEFHLIGIIATHNVLIIHPNVVAIFH